MPIIDQAGWDKAVEVNKDPYGKCCVDVAREVMRILDTDASPITDVHKLVCTADNNIGAGGITGFMAGCVANMVSHLHSRGEEFRKAWNKEWGVKEDKGGVVNPAILTVG